MTTPSQEFLLSAMRAAALRARLMETDIKTIGIGLSGGMITIDVALKWLNDVGAMGLVGEIPESIKRASAAVENGNKRLAQK